MGWVENAGPEVEAQSQYPTIIATCVVVSLLSTAIVGGRLYIRATARGLASDDYMSALSMFFALTYTVLCIARESTPRPAWRRQRISFACQPSRPFSFPQPITRPLLRPIE